MFALNTTLHASSHAMLSVECLFYSINNSINGTALNKQSVRAGNVLINAKVDYQYLLRHCMSFWGNFDYNVIKQLKWNCNYQYTIWFVASYGWQFQLQWLMFYLTSDFSRIYNAKVLLEYQRTRHTYVFRGNHYKNETT
jgi:hypothetical protein